MTPKQIEKMNKLAKEFVGSEICFGGLEYATTSMTASECITSYKAGYAAAHNDATAIIEKLEKALMIYSSTEHEPDDRPNPWEAREVLTQLNKWRQL